MVASVQSSRLDSSSEEGIGRALQARMVYPLPKRTDVVQVKYTNQDATPQGVDINVRFFGTERDSMLLVQDKGARLFQLPGAATDVSLSFSGSNQAREGRLVDALAVRGDEGRDTLR